MLDKGIQIMIAIFILIAVAHFFSLKLVKAPERKKKRLRTFFFYAYGIFYMILGIIQSTLAEINIIFPMLQILLGLVILILNYLGKLNPKS